ncbi:MAG: acyl-CoA thioesterase-2 [Gammaproteobacteria bacterium]|jgi:acyl-CoA thioesterase-2
MILDLLNLSQTGNDQFEHCQPFDYGHTLYGGQLVSQALRAAYHSVSEGFRVHSLHSYFMRPGFANAPLQFRVTRMRDGRAFCQRQVEILQNGKVIYHQISSFKQPIIGPEHQRPIPKPLPDPLQYPDEVELLKASGLEMRKGMENWFNLPLETRLPDPQPFDKPIPMSEKNPAWIRYVGESEGLTPVLQDCLFAFMSDYYLLDSSIRVHGLNWWVSQIDGTSLDHAIWFHRPIDCTDWLFFDQVSPTANAGTCFNRGEIFNQAGSLLASIAQEGLLRD